MKTVEFVRENMPYRTGETVAFDDAVADRMVRGGAAKHVLTVAEVVADLKEEGEHPAAPAQTTAVQAGYKRKG